MTALDRIRHLCRELLAAQDDEEAVFAILPELRIALQEATKQNRSDNKSNGNGSVKSALPQLLNFRSFSSSPRPQK
jgi:hypothetical protein